MPRSSKNVLLTILAITFLAGCGSVSKIPVTPSLPAGESRSQILVEGRVLKFDNKDILVESGNEQITLNISGQTIVWDGISWIAEIPIEIGDFVTAWGTWNPDHSLTTDRLYINIVNLQGKVDNIVQDKSNPSFFVASQDQKMSRIVVSPLTEIYASNNPAKSTYQENRILPQIGDYVEIIGRRQKDGSILAVNIALP